MKHVMEKEYGLEKLTAVEISCGMEINKYGPREDDERVGDLL